MKFRWTDTFSFSVSDSYLQQQVSYSPAPQGHKFPCEIFHFTRFCASARWQKSCLTNMSNGWSWQTNAWMAFQWCQVLYQLWHWFSLTLLASTVRLPPDLPSPAVLKSFMAERREMNVKPFLVVYNLFLVILSLWMSVEGFRNAYEQGFNLVCNNVDYSMNEVCFHPSRLTSDKNAVGLSRVLYVFYLSKFVEFIDTIVMVLRKKNDQVTFLHLYHHVSMPLLWWIGAR